MQRKRFLPALLGLFQFAAGLLKIAKKDESIGVVGSQSQGGKVTEGHPEGCQSVGCRLDGRQRDTRQHGAGESQQR